MGRYEWLRDRNLSYPFAPAKFGCSALTCTASADSGAQRRGAAHADHGLGLTQWEAEGFPFRGDAPQTA